MSFWGATVITNIIRVIPFVGPDITIWLWGGFSVRGATLTRFYSLHFFLPFVLLALIIIHLIFLHQGGSNNPVGGQTPEKVPFHPFFTSKDLMGFLFVFFFIYVSNFLLS